MSSRTTVDEDFVSRLSPVLDSHVDGRVAFEVVVAAALVACACGFGVGDDDDDMRVCVVAALAEQEERADSPECLGEAGGPLSAATPSSSCSSSLSPSSPEDASEIAVCASDALE